MDETVKHYLNYLSIYHKDENEYSKSHSFTLKEEM